MVGNAFTLSITEVFYKPVIGNEFEFVEVKNVGAQSLLLTDVQLYIDGAPSTSFSFSFLLLLSL